MHCPKPSLCWPQVLACILDEEARSMAGNKEFEPKLITEPHSFSGITSASGGPHTVQVITPSKMPGWEQCSPEAGAVETSSPTPTSSGSLPTSPSPASDPKQPGNAADVAGELCVSVLLVRGVGSLHALLLSTRALQRSGQPHAQVLSCLGCQ